MSKRKRDFECENDPDNFCYVCGEYTQLRDRRSFTNILQDAYLHYFGIAGAHLDAVWTPFIVCNQCKTTLVSWAAGSTAYVLTSIEYFIFSNYIFFHNRRYFKFDVPMLWREPISHADDCYVCKAKIVGKGRHRRAVYAVTSVATLPVPHLDTVPYPICPDSTRDKRKSDESVESTKTNGSDCESQQKSHRLSQAELNDWIRDLELSKKKAELLASRMQQSNFLAPGVKVTYYRNRNKLFSRHFSKKDNICYCNDVPALFLEFGTSYDATEWRLFIDGSKESLKAVLLHNGNDKPSVPIAHAVNTKESYETMVELLKCINYEAHEWVVCADLKVVAMLCGLQGGYTGYAAFSVSGIVGHASTTISDDTGQTESISQWANPTSNTHH